MLTAIVLAAGTSQRMGDKNKLLLPYKNKAVVAHVAGNVHSSGISEIIVVLGFEAEKVKEALGNLPIRFVENPEYETGMTGSIRHGVEVANGDGYMICLADLVEITPGEYALMEQKFVDRLATDGKCICLPSYQNQKGNPVIFSAYYRRAILAHKDPEGCRSLVASNKEHVYEIAMPTPHILQDIDFPADYEKLRMRDAASK